MKDILGEVHPGEAAITKEIGNAIIRLSDRYDAETVFYAPLAIGNHIDHQLIHQVGLSLHDAGLKVLFYEDYPYADIKEYFRIPCRLLLGRDNGRLRMLEPLLLLFFLLLAKQGWLPGKKYQSVEERAEEEGLMEETIPLSEHDITAKSHSVAAYTSQIPMLFENEGVIRERFALRARCLGGERVWRKGISSPHFY
ncbi:MAG: hypothetical protein WGN25_06855 [Candidatus Electrothrix sp. GW3-4]|uniref:hypothetical protein n=1 Tax=Candidatus Electrothrix sp. GW3-4 TaxID=3126740 RepID=UPI0030D25661